ncbi:MFS transporter [Nocardia farcinica]|uniref:Putative transporter n=1 Tax=Nocardia farcinica (strain IFM 10152) TaxID=247156 RepID=Q5YZW6_NOCFA|nr:MFS transporter [Nocardia farcinica]BAD56275.1 putative transporter [Nocardia farcinica IFM 10152]
MTTTTMAAPVRDRARERRIARALFAAGLTTFASMYSAQALLPSLSVAFGATPAHAALAVSLTTGFLALAIIPVSALSGRFGRTRVMIGSATATAVIGLLLPLSPSLDVLLAGRAVQGIALAGVPAVAMAYLAEEIDGAGLGAAMGIYVAGTSIGGLAGRLLPSVVLDVASWRWAAAAVGAGAALGTLAFVRLLPPARTSVARTAGWRTVRRDLAAQVRNPALLALFGLAAVLMGGFVSLYNFLGYRLTEAPFALPAAAAGAVFLLYLAGTATSALAGRLADRFGGRRVLAVAFAMMAAGLAATVPDRLVGVIAGMLLYTAGFFAAHAVAGAMVGTLAVGDRGAAASLYLFAYYLGGAVVGGATGLAYAEYGWAGTACAVGALLVLGTGLLAVLPGRGERTPERPG